MIALVLFAGTTYHYVQANNQDSHLMINVQTDHQEDNLVRDVVPDEATTIKIAEAIWLPKYGNRIYSKVPFKAQLKDSTIWIVKGTIPRGMKGGPHI